MTRGLEKGGRNQGDAIKGRNCKLIGHFDVKDTWEMFTRATFSGEGS
jgi:hypothetical protein